MEDVRRIDSGREAAAVTLDDLAREGARRMIAAALDAEVEQYVDAFAGEVDETVSDWSSVTAGRRSGV